MDLGNAREILLRHSKSSRNGQFPLFFTHERQMTNPVCGDQVHLKIHVDGVLISDIGFSANACAICSASSSILCEQLKSQSVSEAFILSEQFEDSILAPLDRPWPLALNAFKSFEHLKVNPARRACALLPWIAFRSAIKEV